MPWCFTNGLSFDCLTVAYRWVTVRFSGQSSVHSEEWLLRDVSRRHDAAVTAVARMCLHRSKSVVVRVVLEIGTLRQADGLQHFS